MVPWDARVETSDIMFPKKLRDFQSETTLLSNFQLCIKLGKTSRSVSIKGVCSLHIPIERGIHHVSCLVILAGYLGVFWLAQQAATFLLTTMPTKNGKIYLPFAMSIPLCCSHCPVSKFPHLLWLKIFISIIKLTSIHGYYKSSK